MLLRQALEQTRARMPMPVLFNSSIDCDRLDEVHDMTQEDTFCIRFPADRSRAAIRSFVRGFAGQVRQAQPYRRSPIPATGAQA